MSNQIKANFKREKKKPFCYLHIFLFLVQQIAMGIIIKNGIVSTRIAMAISNLEIAISNAGDVKASPTPALACCP
ncbi:hypothetical protein G8B22_03835 [Ligilactobacillus agilis]|uniref:hypothetical protein n=1 Tax=Ligilactobacillus agilis TaxID=1601 RepID=UPI0011CA0716|nr:hypothetical protein [Ligilactobacillus agilis]UNL42340.1 hypothetical protein G8B22_03835 [Ligilactobacillus agilis]UNL57306.1 hypothetical protein G8B19_00240 [Ligilactobacillus agilis]